MRVSNWNIEKYDGEIIGASMDRLRKAAEVVRVEAIQKLGSQYGRGKTTGISHGPYKTGKYAGQPWTARDFGSLLKTIRVTEKWEVGALVAVFGEEKNVRVYAGNYLVWWAKIFEYYRPYLRPALNKSKDRIRQILENG